MPMEMFCFMFLNKTSKSLFGIRSGCAQVKVIYLQTHLKFCLRERLKLQQQISSCKQQQQLILYNQFTVACNFCTLLPFVQTKKTYYFLMFVFKPLLATCVLPGKELINWHLLLYQEP